MEKTTQNVQIFILLRHIFNETCPYRVFIDKKTPF
jgi:hypothetical protein